MLSKRLFWILTSVWLIVLVLCIAQQGNAQTKVVDKKFLIVHTIYGLAIAGDDYTTVDVLGNCHRCTEQTFIYGNRPSKPRVAIQSGLEFVGVVGVDYWLKKKYPNSLAWSIFPSAFSLSHGVGFSVNLSHIFAIRKNSYLRD